MLDNSINPNPFAAINPKKLLHYRFVKRVRQTFNVFYGGFDRDLDRYAGIFDWLTIGSALLVKWGLNACHAEAQRTSPLFYIPYAALGLFHLALKGLRIVFSAVMTIISFLPVVLFHAGAGLIQCCLDPQNIKDAEHTLRSPAKMEKALGETAHELGKGLGEITHQVQSPDDRTQSVKHKMNDMLASSKQKIWQAGKGAAHKIKKETKKLLDQDNQGLRF